MDFWMDANPQYRKFRLSVFLIISGCQFYARHWDLLDGGSELVHVQVLQPRPPAVLNQHRGISGDDSIQPPSHRELLIYGSMYFICPAT